MGRHALRRGQRTQTTWETRTPDERDWMAARSRPTGWRPPRGTQWRARCRLALAAGTKRVTAQGSTKTDADEALTERVAQMLRDDGVGGRKATLGELVADALDEIVEGRTNPPMSQRTRTTYASIHRLWMADADVSRTRIDELTTGDLRREVARLHDAGATSSLRAIRALWTHGIDRALADGLIETNPVRDLGTLPKLTGQKIYKNEHPRPKRNSLTDAECQTLLDTAYARKRTRDSGIADLIAVEMVTGLRISEINSIRWKDIDLDGDPPTLTVNGKLVVNTDGEHVFEEITKSRLSHRTIPLDESAVEILRRRWDAGVHSPYVFPTTTGKPRRDDSLNKAIRRLLDAAGLPWAITHTLRRTVENRLLKSGVPEIDVERFMGHTGEVSRAAYVDRSHVPLSALPALGLKQSDQ